MSDQTPVFGFEWPEGVDPADGPAAFQALAEQVEAVLADQGYGFQTGDVKTIAFDTPDDGWLLCDGAAVSRITHADLFAKIGIKYGAGNGSTTFNLPNLQGRVPVGKDTAQTEFDVLGEAGGAKTVALTTAKLPAHTHTDGSLVVASHTHADGTLAVASHFHGITTDVFSPAGAHAHNPSGGNPASAPAAPTGPSQFTNTGAAAPDVTGNTGSAAPDITGNTGSAGSGETHENMPPFQVFNWAIKT